MSASMTSEEGLKALEALGFGDTPAPKRKGVAPKAATDHPSLITGSRAKFMPAANSTLLASQGRVMKLQSQAADIEKRIARASADQKKQLQAQLHEVNNAISSQVHKAIKYKKLHKAAHVTWIVFAVALVLGVIAGAVVLILYETNNLGAKRTVKKGCLDGEKNCTPGTYTYSKHGRIKEPDFDPRVLPEIMKLNGKDPSKDTPVHPSQKHVGEDFEVYGTAVTPAPQAVPPTRAAATAYVPHTNGLVDGGSGNCVNVAGDATGEDGVYSVTNGGGPCNCGGLGEGACGETCKQSCANSAMCASNDPNDKAECVRNCQSLCPGSSHNTACNTNVNSGLSKPQKGCNQSNAFYNAFNACVAKFSALYPLDKYPNSSPAAFCKMACSDPHGAGVQTANDGSLLPYTSAKCQSPFVPQHEAFKCMAYINQNYNTKPGDARRACIKACTFDVHGIAQGKQTAGKYGKQQSIQTVGPKGNGCMSAAGWDDLAAAIGLRKK